MFKAFKVIHIVGVAMFLGSIFAHITAGQVPGATADPPAMLFARQAIDLATRYVTLPGLAIAILSGVLMTASENAHSPDSSRAGGSYEHRRMCSFGDEG